MARHLRGPTRLHDLELEDEFGFLLPPNEVEGFWDYVEEFIRYEKRTPIRVWTGSAWPIKTRKGQKQKPPTVLYDDKITSNLAEYPQSIVLRHLQGRHVISTMPGRRCQYDCLDLDNHEGLLGWVHDQIDTSPFERPFTVERRVSLISLPYLLRVKQVFDEFPGRVWSISSDSLGLHALKRWPQARFLKEIEITTGGSLKRLGIPHSEFFPRQDTPFRRPFGRDYITITPTRLLRNWQAQLRCYLNPQPISFENIVDALLEGQQQHWKNLESRIDGRAWYRLAPLGHKFFTGRSLEKGLLDACGVEPVLTWRDSRFDLRKGQEIVESLNRQESSVSVGFSSGGRHQTVLDMKSINNGQWVQSVKEWAENGLPCDDSITEVVGALARWFYFIELFHLPEEQRRDRVVELMQTFCQHKNNGYITQLNNGGNITKRVARIVKSAIRTTDDDGKMVFLRIRQKRERGDYQKLYMFEQLVQGLDHVEVDDSGMCSFGSTLSVGLTIDDDTPLPEAIEEKIDSIICQQRMRKRHGEYPFRTFSRRFVNCLWRMNGKSRITWRDINAMLGNPESRDRKQAHQYKTYLAEAGIIEGDWEQHIKRGQASSLYRLTKNVISEFMTIEAKECRVG